MRRMHRLAYAVSHAGALVGGALLLLAAVVIGLDILLRTFLARTIGGADELSGYALAIATAWGLSFALLHRAHIRIDSFYELLPAWMRAALDVISLLAFILFVGLITWHAWGVLSQSIASNARSISALSAPLVVPQALWFFGFVFLMLVLLLLLVESLIAWAKGDHRALARLIGSKAVVEEIQEEIQQTGPPSTKGDRRP